MAVNDFRGVVISEGEFLYAGITPMKITIVAHNYDLYFAMAKEDGYLEPNEEPMPLGDNGLLYRIQPSQSGLFQTMSKFVRPV
jgi:hypothetical protein